MMQFRRKAECTQRNFSYYIQTGGDRSGQLAAGKRLVIKRERTYSKQNRRTVMPENEPQAPPTITPPPTSAPPSASAPAPDPGSQARMWCMFCHLSALAGYVIPFGNIIGPLIIWQIKKNEYSSVDIHGKAALNFQITATIAILVTLIAAVILSFFCIGYLLIPIPALIGLADLVFVIIAGIKANNGEDYKYPWSIDFVK
jgi:uncharacterized Tic20 family protein